MASFNKFNCFVADVSHALHDMMTGTSQVYKVYLTNTAPTASNTVYNTPADLSAANGYTAGGYPSEPSPARKARARFKFSGSTDPAWTAAGGSIGPFQFAVLYNATSATQPLIGWWDYGTAITLTNGNTFTVSLGPTNDFDDDLTWPNFLDVCRFTPAAGGTTDWAYSAAVTGYQSPSAASVVNGTIYQYRAESADLTQWEIGEGAYSSSTGTFARTTVLFNSSGNTSKINFSGVPQVAIVALAEDLPSLTKASNAFTGNMSIAGTVTTGALSVSGGVGASGAGNFGGSVAAPTIVPNAAPITAWGVDFVNSTITLAASTNSGALPSGSGLLFLTDGTVSGSTALYLVGGSTQPVLVGQSGAGSHFLAGTTTPGANQYSVGFDGSNYRIYNGSGGSITFTVGMLKTRTSV